MLCITGLDAGRRVGLEGDIYLLLLFSDQTLLNQSMGRFLKFEHVMFILIFERSFLRSYWVLSKKSFMSLSPWTSMVLANFQKCLTLLFLISIYGIFAVITLEL